MADRRSVIPLMVLSELRKKPMTRTQLTIALGVRYNSIMSAIDRLLEFRLIEGRGYTRNDINGRYAPLYGLKII